MMKLHVLPEAFGLRNPGPFAFKCELAITHLKLGHELLDSLDPRTGPKGQMPYLDDEGTIVADSDLILQYVDAKTDGGLYGHLTDVQWADGIAYMRLAEEHLYWLMVASRWLEDAWFPHIKSDFFGSMPFPINHIAPMLARREVKQTYHLQGLGRHTHEELSLIHI